MRADPSLLKLDAWFQRLRSLPAFKATLPEDAEESGFVLPHRFENLAFPFRYSQKLADIYTVYAEGVGLKSVNFAAKQ